MLLILFSIYHPPRSWLGNKIKEIKLVQNESEKSSVINVVADKINLLSHKGDKTFNITDPKNLITDDEQEIINNNAHPVVYGDNLVQFLELIKLFVNSHVHAYHGSKPDQSDVVRNINDFTLETILNKNINTN